jgi:hypothetical protein
MLSKNHIKYPLSHVQWSWFCKKKKFSSTLVWIIAHCHGNDAKGVTFSSSFVCLGELSPVGLLHLALVITHCTSPLNVVS